ncbi:MAG: T9SS type A sorting domain-containing protein, partial [Prolixibacteraceae bacterium]|nr:T9SS type A sorting domain-containing protein [Prolixibacteraceae bacterium]
VTNFTGSKIDPRMAGRGSGIWCYRSKNLTVQHNKFMHARGIHDSYGMHIDIGNRNVVYQYNYSEDNEGGFVEILGENVNVGYRYNLSVGDGWRKRGNRFGQIFWLAGWSGDWQNPIGSDSIFIYNNSIYVRDTIAPGIWIEEVSKNARIYNNIIKVSNEFGSVVIKNSASLNDFDNNIWFGNIPIIDEDGQSYRGANAMTSDPMFVDEIVIDSSGFVLQDESPAIISGKLIYNSEFSSSSDFFHNNGGLDYFGNAVSFSQRPNIGAFNTKPLDTGIIKDFDLEQSLNIYPNPLQNKQLLYIEFSPHINVQNLTIQIVDIIGKLRSEKSFQQQNRIRLETGYLTRGMYFIRLKTSDFCWSKQLLVL